MDTSLNAIRSFEAAARHLNFARAAGHLGVQPPAVSRQVAELERQLGVTLFVRSKPRLALTWQGEALYQSVRRGLNEIRQGCDAVRRRDDDTPLRVATSIGMTQCWLLARLNGFYQQYPEVELQLTTHDSTVNLDTRGADIAVVFGEEDQAGNEASRVFRDAMIPVCAPDLLPGLKMLTAAELADQHLLHCLEPILRDDWRLLLGSAGIDAPPPDHSATFNSYAIYLQASLNGAGIAIGWERLLEDYLENGSLCRAADLRLETRRGYYCYITPEGAEKPAAHQFRDWICALVQTET